MEVTRKGESLLILGAGQYGTVAREIAESTGCFVKIDFLDDNVDTAVGKFADYIRLADSYTCAFVAIGYSELRLSWIHKLSPLYRIATLVSPAAHVSPSAELGCGSIVEPTAAINTNASVANGVIISAGAVVNHDSVIGDGCHIDCGAVVPSNTTVPSYTKVNCGDVYVAPDKNLTYAKQGIRLDA